MWTCFLGDRTQGLDRIIGTYTDPVNKKMIKGINSLMTNIFKPLFLKFHIDKVGREKWSLDR